MTIDALQPSTEITLDMNKKEPIRVLHVDNDSGLLLVMKECLELASPFRVDSALSVDEALEKMGKTQYDVVVSDYRMPGKDGLTFLKKLREEGNAIPFIILTGKGMEEVAAQALNLGADHYINKSENSELMFSEIANDIVKAVGRKRMYLAAFLRQERLKAILDSSPNAIMIIDLQCNIIECNRETLRLTRFSSKEEVIDKNLLSFVEERDRQRISKSVKTA